MRWHLADIDGFGELFREATLAGVENWPDELVDISDESPGGDMAAIQRNKLRIDVRKLLLSRFFPMITVIGSPLVASWAAMARWSSCCRRRAAAAMARSPGRVPHRMFETHAGAGSLSLPTMRRMAGIPRHRSSIVGHEAWKAWSAQGAEGSLRRPRRGVLGEVVKLGERGLVWKRRPCGRPSSGRTGLTGAGCPRGALIHMNSRPPRRSRPLAGDLGASDLAQEPTSAQSFESRWG
jgi:hypothetical protein